MRFRVFAALAALVLPREAAHAQDGCVDIPPLRQVRAAAIYADAAGSRLDLAGLHRNAELIRPLRSFTAELVDAVDGGGPAALDCARGLLSRWASARALLREPDDFPAMRERQRFALGITLAALKLRAQDGPLQRPVRRWLRALNGAVVADFARRDRTDNLEVWSAANAAALALLDGDAYALAYQDSIWRAALAQIGPDGMLPSEMRRQSRALLYHAYYASALLVLRQLRAAMGIAATAEETAALRRLMQRIGDLLCDPSSIAAAAGATQEALPPAQFAVPLVFGEDLIDAQWRRCAAHPETWRDDTLGGDLHRTRAMLAAAPGTAAGEQAH